MEKTIAQYGFLKDISEGKLPWLKEKPETKVKILERELNKLQNKNNILTEKLNQLNDEKEEMISSIKTLVQECEGYHYLLQNERNKTASLAAEIKAKANALVHWETDKEALE